MSRWCCWCRWGRVAVVLQVQVGACRGWVLLVQGTRFAARAWRQLETSANFGIEYVFVIKTAVEGPGTEGQPPRRVFINVCTSDKVAEATSKKTTNAQGQSGSHWSIPFSLGSQQTVAEPDGEEVLAMDFVVNPATRAKFQKHKALQNLLVETALEHGERTMGEGRRLRRKCTFPTVPYKGQPGQEKPGVQAVKTGKGKDGAAPGPAPNGRIPPKARPDPGSFLEILL